MSHRRTILCKWYVHQLSRWNLSNHLPCRSHDNHLHSMQRWEIRPSHWRSQRRLHDLLQHGRLLLCDKDLANSTGDWDEYNGGLYSVPNRNVLATHPNRQHSLHALQCWEVRPHDWSALCRLYDLL